MFLDYLINKKDKPWYILTSNSTVVIDTSNLSPSRIAARWLISLPMALAWNYPRSYCLSFLISILMIQIGDMSSLGQTNCNLFIYFQKICWDLGDDHLILSGGGGGLALLVGTDYIFSSRARPENWFPGKPRTEYLFFNRNKFLKKKKTRGGGG